MAEQVPAHIAHPCKDYPTSYNYFSTFREEPGLSVGDAYSGGQAAFEKSTLSRHAGKRLVNRPPLEGKTPDVYFDKAVGSLRDGDVYMDPLYLEKALKAMVGGKNSSAHPFYPPKNSKKSACPGDPTPCMGTVGLLGADWSNNPPGPAPKKPGKNLYTNPGRRGGMGFSHKDRTIGQNPPTYMPDTYQHGRQLGKELRRKARERIVKPFNSSPNKGNGMFNSNPFKNPPGPDTMEEKANKVALKKPFIPSNPPKKGAAYETISKTGREYVPNPVVEAKFQGKSEGKTGAFKPCGGIKDRLSMHTVNPYQYDARPPPDLDFTLLP